MRSLVIAALLAAMLGAAGFILGGAHTPDAGEARLARGPAPTAPPPAAPRAAAPAAQVRPRAAAGDEGTLYQYVDGSGSVRFVRSLAEVPPAWRERAGRLEAGGAGTFARGGPAASARAHPWAREASAPVVVVYTAPWCGWCRKTLAWLDARGVAYRNKDIEADAGYREELLEKSGGTAVPFVEIDGRAVQGYAPEEMARLLAQPAAG